MLHALSTWEWHSRLGRGCPGELHAAPCYSCLPGATPDFHPIFLVHLTSDLLSASAAQDECLSPDVISPLSFISSKFIHGQPLSMCSGAASALLLKTHTPSPLCDALQTNPLPAKLNGPGTFWTRAHSLSSFATTADIC